MLLNFIDFTNQYRHIILTTLILIAIYLIVKIKINRQRKSKISVLKKRTISDPVETDSPLTNQMKNLKELGYQGLESRFDFMEKALPFILFLVWLVVVNIPYIGKMPTAYVSVLAAVISVMAGFALRPFLENLFSGVVISFFKSIRIGDTVLIDDHYGLIEEIGLTHSTLKIWDWNRLVIPNSKLLQKEIQNLTKNDTYIWAHVEFYVSHEADIVLVEKIAVEAANGSTFFKNSETPSFWIMDLGKDAIKCWVAAWANNPGEAWELRADIRTKLIKEFKKHNIKTHSFIYTKT